MNKKLSDAPHRRFNPLTREWVLVSPHRTERPWQGQIESLPPDETPEYDPACYMCPGNARANGAKNAAYQNYFVFDNDFPALRRNSPQPEIRDGLLVARGESGICRVVCFSPSHNLTLSRMETPAIRGIVDIWVQQQQKLGALPDIQYVQIFENRGAMMGCSNPHPHGQIWAVSSIPNEPAKELEGFRAYRQTQNACVLCDYLTQERKAEERVVYQNDGITVVVPFWAIWPFETLVLANQHVGALPDLSGQDRDALADALKKLTAAYDRLFGVSFPYSMGFHQQPTDQQTYPEWHLHAHFYPPLLRSATVKKFMVGFELLAGPQRDLTPEMAAERLRQAFAV